MAQRNNSFRDNFRLGREVTLRQFSLSDSLTEATKSELLEDFLEDLSLLDIDPLEIKKSSVRKYFVDKKRALAQYIGRVSACITNPCNPTKISRFNRYVRRYIGVEDYPPHFYLFQ